MTPHVALVSDLGQKIPPENLDEYVELLERYLTSSKKTFLFVVGGHAIELIMVLTLATVAFFSKASFIISLAHAVTWIAPLLALNYLLTDIVTTIRKERPSGGDFSGLWEIAPLETVKILEKKLPVKNQYDKMRKFSMVHLVYCDCAGKHGERALDKILSGTKTMMVRDAAGRKIPYSRVFAGERLYFMENGTAKISATASVTSVQNYVKLIDAEISQILEEHQSKLGLTEKEKTRWNKKCLCLVEFENVQPIEPLDFDHQGNMDDWLIIEKIEDVVMGTSIPYNYDQSRF